MKRNGKEIFREKKRVQRIIGEEKEKREEEKEELKKLKKKAGIWKYCTLIGREVRKFGKRII